MTTGCQSVWSAVRWLCRAVRECILWLSHAVRETSEEIREAGLQWRLHGSLLGKMMRSKRRVAEPWEPCAIYREQLAQYRRRVAELDGMSRWRVFMKSRDFLEQLQRLQDDLTGMMHHVRSCPNCKGSPVARRAARAALRSEQAGLRARRVFPQYAKWALVVLVPAVGQLVLYVVRLLLK